MDEELLRIIDLFDEDEVTTADQIDRPQRALDRDAFDDFNKRNKLAGGGMLVQPGFGGVREGFKKDYDVKELDKATEYYTKGEFKKFSDIKGFGQGKNPAFIKKYRNMRTLIKKQLDYHDGKFKIPDKTDVKKTDQTKKLEKYLKGKKTIKQSELIKKLTELGYKDPKLYVNTLSSKKNLNIIRDVERAPLPERKSKIYSEAQLNKASKGMFDGKTYDQLSQKEQIKVRGKLFQQGGKYSKFRKINNPLSKELIKDIKTKFGNVYTDWDFDNYRFGITGVKGENSKLYDKIKRFVAEPKPYELTADLSSADGWLGSQMNRAFKLGDERYVPIKIVRNNKEKIAGFIDNTEFGGGKKYIFSEEFIKGSNVDGILMSNHPDFKETKKYRDIANIAKLPVRGALKNILNSKGVDTSRISLSDLYKYMMNEVGIEGTKNAIEQHHVKGVGVRATGDYQLLNRDLNALARQISFEIGEGNLSRVNELKQKGIRVNVGGQEFGAPQRTASSDFLKIKDDITKFYKEADVTKVKGLIATLSKDPRCNRGFKSQGGRAGFQDGNPPSLDVCYQGGVRNINSGMKNVTPAQAKNFAAFANRAASLGRGVMKYGIVPEALYVAADSVIRMGMGDNFNESFLRATEYLRPGDQTKQAEMLEADRFFGPEIAGIIGRSIDYKNQLAKVQSLEDQKTNLQNLSDVGEFDYIGDLSQDVKNIDARLQQETDNLNNKFKMTEPELIYAERAQDEVDDARSSGSLFTKLKSKFRDVGQDQSDIETLGMTEQTQEDLNKRMLPQAPKIYKVEDGKIIQKNLSEATQTEIMDHVQLLRSVGVKDSTKNLLDQQNMLRGMPISDQILTFGPEATLGFSGTMGEPINKPVFKRPQNVIGDMEKEIVGQTNVANPFDIDLSMIGTGLRGFSAAGGGIAKQAGVSSGPPPESGPMSQGLQGLMKRVRNR